GRKTATPPAHKVERTCPARTRRAFPCLFPSLFVLVPEPIPRARLSCHPSGHHGLKTPSRPKRDSQPPATFHTARSERRKKHGANHAQQQKAAPYLRPAGIPCRCRRPGGNQTAR